MPDNDITFEIEHDGKTIPIDFQDDPTNFQTSIALKDGSRFLIMYIQDDANKQAQPYYYATHQTDRKPFTFELTTCDKNLFAQAVTSMLNAIDK